MSIQQGVSICITCDTDTLTLCLPYKVIQGYENLGFCTSCCQNKITMLLEILEADLGKFVKNRGETSLDNTKHLFMSIQQGQFLYFFWITITVHTAANPFCWQPDMSLHSFLRLWRHVHKLDQPSVQHPWHFPKIHLEANPGFADFCSTKKTYLLLQLAAKSSFLNLFGFQTCKKLGKTFEKEALLSRSL